MVNSGLGERIAEAVIEIVDETRKSELEKLVTKEYLNSSNLVIRSELKEEIASVRTELKEYIVKVSGDISLLKWMVGISISLSLTIIAKIFFP